MFATIYLPDFYLQAALRHQPELRAKPVALIDDQEKKAVIIQLNAAAEQIGVRRGMTPSQGLARCLQLIVKVLGTFSQPSEVRLWTTGSRIGEKCGRNQRRRSTT